MPNLNHIRDVTTHVDGTRSLKNHEKSMALHFLVKNLRADQTHFWPSFFGGSFRTPAGQLAPSNARPESCLRARQTGPAGARPNVRPDPRTCLRRLLIQTDRRPAPRAVTSGFPGSTAEDRPPRITHPCAPAGRRTRSRRPHAPSPACTRCPNEHRSCCRYSPRRTPRPG